MKSAKVTVCISVHNTAKYLSRCLDSVCAQTLQNLEIILVNNGSTDNSEEIMKQYASANPERCFVIISQEDRSLAGGRQTGINRATGDYITFLDADDLVVPEAYEKMLMCAEREKVDIVEIETLRDGDIISSPLTGKQKTHDILRRYLTKGDIPSMLWLRMYKRDLFKKSVLPTFYTNNEDVFAWPCILYAASSIYYIKEPFHTYSTDNEDGVMHAEKVNSRLADRRMESKRKSLLAFPHLCSYIGEENLGDYIDDINYYKANRIFSFLMEDFGGKRMKEKVSAVCSTLDFKNRNELNAYLKRWLPGGRDSIYGIYRMFGINITYYLLQLRLKNK